MKTNYYKKKIKSLLKNKQGFSLVELIVVIAILIVLLTILVPNVLGFIKKAQRANDLNTAKTVGEAAAMTLGDPDVLSTLQNALKHKGGDVYKFKGDNSHGVFVVARQRAAKWNPTVSYAQPNGLVFDGNNIEPSRNAPYTCFDKSCTELIIHRTWGTNVGTWTSTDSDNQSMATLINDTYDAVNNVVSVKYDTKCKSDTRIANATSSNRCNRFMVCANCEKSGNWKPTGISIWVGYGNVPVYEVWPNADPAYSGK